jgi:hypothetical protein
MRGVESPGGGPGAVSQVDRTDTLNAYLERMLKMVPTEVIALYLAGAGILTLPAQRLMLAIWAVFCLFCVALVRTLGSRDPARNQGPQWPVVAISMGAFSIWVYSMGGPFAAYGLVVPGLGSLLMLGFTFLAPYLYKGS